MQGLFVLFAYTHDPMISVRVLYLSHKLVLNTCEVFIAETDVQPCQYQIYCYANCWLDSNDDYNY